MWCWVQSAGCPLIGRMSSYVIRHFFLKVAFFTLAGAGLLDLLGVRFVLRVLIHEGLAA